MECTQQVLPQNTQESLLIEHVVIIKINRVGFAEVKFCFINKRDDVKFTHFDSITDLVCISREMNVLELPCIIMGLQIELQLFKFNEISKARSSREVVLYSDTPTLCILHIRGVMIVDTIDLSRLLQARQSIVDCYFTLWILSSIVETAIDFFDSCLRFEVDFLSPIKTDVYLYLNTGV